MQNWGNGYAAYGDTYMNQGEGFSVDYYGDGTGSTTAVADAD